MKTLIGISGWHGGCEKIAAQRATWGKDVMGADLLFFKGRPHSFVLFGPQPDEVWLKCHDGYAERQQKIVAMIDYALSRGYDYLWKVDDDCYLRPERLLALPPYDYCGAVAAISREQQPIRHFLGAFPQKQASAACLGCLYGLSKRSMLVLLNTPERDWYSPHEDIWVGEKLFDGGITPVHLEGLIKIPNTHGVPNKWANQMPPHANNQVVLSCEYTPEQMCEIHQSFKV